MDIIIILIIISLLITIILIINFNQKEPNILVELTNDYLDNLIYEPLVLNEYKEGDIDELKKNVEILINQYNDLLKEYNNLENIISDLEIIIQENLDEINYLSNEIDKLKESINVSQYTNRFINKY